MAIATMAPMTSPDAPPAHAPPPPMIPRWKAQLPNALTMLRVVLTGVFIALLAGWDATALTRGGVPNATLLWAAGIFVLAAVTDALDGNLARRWKVVSRFGRIMDPFADKVLVLGAFIMLAGPAFAVWSADEGRRIVSGVAPWMVVVILARELLVTSIRAILEGDGIDFSAGWSGKAKMIVQAIAAPLILAVLAWGVPAPGSARGVVIAVCAWGTVVATVVSGVPYVTRAMGMGRSAGA